MLFAMAVPSILAAAIADRENVRESEIAGLIGRELVFAEDAIGHDERSPLAPWAEE